jgi:NAD+ synthase
MTGMKIKALSMPIRQLKFQDDLSRAHLKWLKNKFSNVDEVIINLDEVFNCFEKSLDQFNNELAFANSRARLRMTTLYQVAGANNGIVVGTGNKVEDFGVGFYTKYGDGGVDISPIADCLKSQVWEMGKELKILEDIINAAPTDGLWSDGRTDERQLGMSYEDLEKAMLDSKDKNYEKYLKIRKRNLHKMNLIPICKFNSSE